MAQAKKKATAKAVKPKPSGARKSSEAKPASRRTANSAVKPALASKKPTGKKVIGNHSPLKNTPKKGTTVKKTANRKPASKKAPSKKPASNKAPGKKPASNKAPGKKPRPKKTNPKPDSAAASKKMLASKGALAKTATKPEPAQKAGEKAPVDRKLLAAKAVAQQKPVNSKAEAKIQESNTSNSSAEAGKAKPSAVKAGLRVSEIKAGSSKQPEPGMPVKAKTRKQASGLSHSSSQGPGKPGQKKRGWRDIEALTERARLKSLLSDIWHEDIDLDSDIFGETDSLFGYYTDKEEVVEVEPEADEEWEEFEEEES